MQYIEKIQAHLGAESDYLLAFDKPAVSKTMLHLPESTFIDQVYGSSDRTPQVLRSLGQLFGTGRLANTGYLSIFAGRSGDRTQCRSLFCP
jgi:class I fructose-bisphosphate aldolase